MLDNCFMIPYAGQLARAIYECMRREAASLRIQKDARKYLARKSYGLLCSSAVSIQAGLRGMAARNELQFRKRTNAAIFIQVKRDFLLAFLNFTCHFSVNFLSFRISIMII